MPPPASLPSGIAFGGGVGAAVAPAATGSGDSLAGTDGVVGAFGGAGAYGFPAIYGPLTTTGIYGPHAAPIVAIAATPDGKGYWLTGAGGRVFSFGSAGFHGGASGHRLGAPVVGIAVDPVTGGYWLVTGSGRVYTTSMRRAADLRLARNSHRRSSASTRGGAAGGTASLRQTRGPSCSGGRDPYVPRSAHIAPAWP